jgi:small subunit ribosomal protein S21
LVLIGLGKERALKVSVRENNIDQALRVLKKKLQREGLFRELKRRKAYEKPSERRAREKGEAIRRGRKAAEARSTRRSDRKTAHKAARFGAEIIPAALVSGDGDTHPSLSKRFRRLMRQTQESWAWSSNP